jgi:hypothetical protein
MTISVLTCDDQVDQIVRVSIENGSPQDMQFRDPATIVGAGVSAADDDSNESEITGNLEIEWFTTGAPIVPIASSRYLVWVTFIYACNATTNVFSLSYEIEESEETTVVDSKTIVASLDKTNQKQISLFGLAEVPNVPFIWTVTITSDAGVMTIPAEQLKLLWLELAGPYVPTPDPPT